MGSFISSLFVDPENMGEDVDAFYGFVQVCAMSFHIFFIQCLRPRGVCTINFTF